MLHVCYSAQYFAHTPSNSMEKLALVAEALSQYDYVRFYEPEELDVAMLKQLHEASYVEAFLTGEPRKLATIQGFKPWNAQLKDAVLAVNAGQLKAAELAFKHGLAANIAQGFHHASPDFGCAYCTFNGLALVAQQFPDKRIFVLDCDQHGGNGTAEFVLKMPNLYNFSIYGQAFGCGSYTRAETRHIHQTQGSFTEYQQAIHEGFAAAKAWGADLIIYQAGMDCHQDDPHGSTWFSRDLIEQREQLVFGLAKNSQIPMMFVLAGGYQQLAQLIPLHVRTFEIAQAVYYPDE